tara:strand:+ start:103 stop:747 length:645 start_codon:yes stop_codon:yes gene_type:complete
MKLEINVPSSLNEITLGQYQKFLEVAEKNPEGNFLNAKMIEIFCGIPLSDSYKLKVGSANQIISILSDMLEQKPQHVEQFNLNGVDYGFIPDLDEMSLGEYIDLDTNASKWEQMHVAMNVLYRPIKTSKVGKYNIKEYDVKYPEVMKDMPLDAALGSLFFFYNLGMELAKHTMLSLDNQAEMETIQEKQTLMQSMDGTPHSLAYHLEMLQRLTK